MKQENKSWWRILLQRLLIISGTLVATALIFLVLPFLQTISARPEKDLLVRSVEVADVPPPPPPPEEEKKEEEKPEEPPPELTETPPPLDLSQLELSMGGGIGEGIGGDFAIKLPPMSAQTADNFDAIFDSSDIDQKPRVIFQSPPSYPQELMRKKQQGVVYILFVVDQNGRVVNPKIEKSSNPAFEKPALEAVKQWKFEPGMRSGKKVQVKMRVPIKFAAT